MQHDENRKRAIKSFVIRASRMTEAQKRILTDDSHQYKLSSVDDFCHLLKNHPFNKVIFEVGYGNGHSLLSLAEKSQDTLFVGIEVYPSGVAQLLQGINDKNLENLYTLQGDVMAVLPKIPDACLDKIQIFFPDPWPKKRHHKRRLVNTQFLQLVLPKLKRKGIFHFATDWQPYGEAVREAILDHNELVPIDEASTEYLIHAQRETTHFERRGLRLGHEIMDLVHQFCA